MVIVQAEALRSKAQRPETVRQQQQLARYLYYLGRIQAVQLDYTDAKDSLQQAARKVRAARSPASRYVGRERQGGSHFSSC